MFAIVSKAVRFKAAVLFVLLSSLAACGVKGPPRPPERSAELGRGQPSFTRATEQFAFPDVPSPDGTPQPAKKQQGGDAN
jgi:predicted small lipoprotein YifL